MHFKRGFTLVELLVVISIIGVLASIILVAVQGARQKGVQAAALEFATTNYHAFGTDAILYEDFSNKSAADEAGNYPWVITPNAITWSSDTPSGSGWSIGGGSVQYSLNNGIQAFTSPMTVSLWVKSTSGSWPSNFPVLEMTGSDGSNGECGAYCVGIVLNGSSLQFGYAVSGSSASLPASSNWTNITYSYNSASELYKLYINGVPTAIQGGSGLSLPPSGYPNWPGSGSMLQARSGSLLVDDLAIYSQVLSDAQVHDLYAMGAAEHGITLK